MCSLAYLLHNCFVGMPIWQLPYFWQKLRKAGLSPKFDSTHAEHGHCPWSQQASAIANGFDLLQDAAEGHHRLRPHHPCLRLWWSNSPQDQQCMPLQIA